MNLLGSHVPFLKSEDYLLGANKRSLENGANCMMFYLGPSQNTTLAAKENIFLDEYLKENNKIDINNIVVHGPHPVNYSSVKPELLLKSREFLIREINLMQSIGLKYLVIHPGSYTGGTKEESISNFVETVKSAIVQTKDVEILIETMAGKGKEIGTSLEEIKDIVDLVDDPRFGICLDTCHLWDSGLNIKPKGALSKKIKSLELLEKVKVIHINDSKNELGSSKDRHENIGDGKIGLKTLQDIVNDKDFINKIKVLETPPIDKVKNYFKHKEEIEMLLSV